MADQKNRDNTTLFGWTAFVVTLLLLPALFGYGFYRQGKEINGNGVDQVDRVPLEVIEAVAEGFFYPVPSSREELLVRLAEVAGQAGGTFGVYVIELDTGQGFGFNEGMMFEAASTNKIPVLVKLYSEAEAGRISMDQVMTYTWSDVEGGTGSIQIAGIGSQWTVAQLAEKMVRESDNVAKNMLLRLLGFNEVESFVRGYGVDFSLYYNRTTPRDMANLLQLLYQERIVGNQLSYEMLGLMIDTEFENRLPLYLEGVPVANKIGTMGGAVNDVGVVLLEDRPFVISVYSENASSVGAAEEAIGRLAAYAYYYELNRD